jgi:hypothetical protein
MTEYTKTTWVDETLDGAERYDIKDNVGAPIHEQVQIALKNDVLVAGTPVNAENLNKLEQGVHDAQDVADIAHNKADSPVSNRQGGSATNWNTVGTNNYVPTGEQLIQVGNAASGAGGDVTVTFPVAFSAKPVVFATCDVIYGLVQVDGVTASQFVGKVWKLQGSTPYHLEAGNGSFTFNWIAIGPA